MKPITHVAIAMLSPKGVKGWANRECIAGSAIVVVEMVTVTHFAAMRNRLGLDISVD